MVNLAQELGSIQQRNKGQLAKGSWRNSAVTLIDPMTEVLNVMVR
jgi:hypothetical protein